jgi:uncharacterized protein (TIGR03437 family)
MPTTQPHPKTARLRLLATLCAVAAALATIHATRKTLLPAAHAQGAAAPPSTLPVGDFNSDGRLDIAYYLNDPDTNIDSIMTCLGNGDGTFQSPVQHPVGTSLKHLRVADFTGDGKLDLLAYHTVESVPYVSVLPGRGDGTFAAKKSFLLERGKIWSTLEVGDFTGDGKPDVFLIGEPRLLKNNGDGTFTSQLVPGANFVLVYALASGDFNLDGKRDLLLALGQNGVSVWFGNGDGTFGGRTDYITAGEVRNVLAADMDGDGKLDVVTTNDSGASFTVLYNQGAGVLGNRKDYGRLTSPSSLIAADFNSDGKLEVVFFASTNENQPKPTVSLYPGLCGGRLDTEVRLGAIGGQSLLPGDFNNDGKLDLVATAADGVGGFYPETFLSPNAGPPVGTCAPDAALAAVSFAPPAVSKAAPAQFTLVAADFNRDGRPDLAGTNLYEPAGVSVSLNDGAGRFADWTQASRYPLDRADRLYTADINADGNPDLLVLRYRGSLSSPVYVTPLLGRGDGTFMQAADTYIGLADEVGLNVFMTTGDFNADGKLDFALSANQVFVYLGQGNNTFTRRAAYTLGTPGGAGGSYEILAADFDGDGKLDLLTANGPSSTYSALFGTGDGTFVSRDVTPQGLPAAYPTGGKGASDLTYGDFNGDGRAEVVIANSGTPVFAFLSPNADRTFTSRLVTPEYSGVLGPMQVGDFNKDGKLDLAYISSHSFVVMPGLGDGTFSWSLLTDAGQYPVGIAKGDFDGDGRLDLALTRLGLCGATCPSSIAVFRNATSAANPQPSPTPTPRPTPTPTPPPLSYTIRGRVTNELGEGIPNVEVVLSGSVSLTRRAIGGAYQFNLLPRGGTYTVTVRGGGYNYTPRSKTFTNLNGDATADFRAADPLEMVTVHSATYRTDEHAFESIATLFGTGLSTVTDIAPSLPLPTEIRGNTVRVIDSQGVDRAAPLFYVSPTQINYQIPIGTAAGTAYVYATSADGTTSACNVLITQTAPGLFSANNSGQGYAAADIQRVKADGSQTYEHMMQYDPQRNDVLPISIDLGPEGEQVYLVLYGTGLRYRTHISKVTARIGAQAATVPYCGPQPQFTGLDQVNVLIPRALKGAGEVDVALTVDGKAVNVLRVKIK